MLEVGNDISGEFHPTMGISALKFWEGSFFLDEILAVLYVSWRRIFSNFQLQNPTLKKQLILCQWFFNVFFGHFFGFLFSGFFSILYIS